MAREAMRNGALLPPMGADGKAVAVDETFIGQRKEAPRRRGNAHKHAVLSLVERGGKKHLAEPCLPPQAAVQ